MKSKSYKEKLIFVIQLLRVFKEKMTNLTNIFLLNTNWFKKYKKQNSNIYLMAKKQINLLGEDVEPDRVKNHFFNINLNKMNEVSLRKLVIEELRKHKSIIAFSEGDSFEKIARFFITFSSWFKKLVILLEL